MMSNNTVLRIISALVLTLVISICFVAGPIQTLLLIFLIGAIIVDEIYCNFFKEKRFSRRYFASQLLFILPFFLFNFVFKNQFIFDIFVKISLFLNIFLLFYLIYSETNSDILFKKGKKYSFLVGLFVLLPMMSIATLINSVNWQFFVIVLLVVNYSMDSGAWFVGKNFGKRKLWPSVSPNKTVEGFLGGAIIAGLSGGLFWHLFFEKMEILNFFFFAIFGILSQLGDLVQSKFKRQCKIKDSSSLIPGHGGFYDRLDSLLYLAPFFASTIYSF